MCSPCSMTEERNCKILPKHIDIPTYTHIHTYVRMHKYFHSKNIHLLSTWQIDKWSQQGHTSDNSVSIQLQSFDFGMAI